MAVISPYYQEYLIQHAAKLVWCSPYEDEQYIIEAAQLTDANGDIIDTMVFERLLSLPNNADRFHMYMIGGNYPDEFNLSLYKERWIPITEWCLEADFLVRIYNDAGILVPLCNVFYFLEDDGTILFAIREDGDLGIKFGVEPIYFHFRSSHFWKMNNQTERTKRVYVDSRIYKKGTDLSDMVNAYNDRYEKDYHNPLIFTNGRPSNKIMGNNYGDYVEMSDDGSVTHVEYHSVKSLRSFHSDLDKCNKYLLMLKHVQDKRKIHYRDDIEIFPIYVPRLQIVNYMKMYPEATLADAIEHAEFEMGNYYHRNREDSLRMVTHQAYSLPVDYLLSSLTSMQEKIDIDNWYLKVVVHESGLDRNLIAERHHVMELYQLDYEKRLDAMTDTASNIDVWKASELEKSDYNYLMRCFRHELTAERVLDAYGYDQASLALANPNVSITKDPNKNYFIIPVGLMDSCTIYEYDRDGLLLGWYYSTDTMKYYPVNEWTIYIEAISGKGSHEISLYKDVGIGDKINVTTNAVSNYRLYRITKVLGLNNVITYQGGYRDVTNVATNFVQRDGGFSFTNGDPANVRYDVVGDDKFLCRDLILVPASDGVVDFTLVHGENNEILDIAPAKITVWLNGRALIENIDYRVDFPRVIIFSKQYLKGMTEQNELHITYRALGFSRDGKTTDKPREVGYVIDGKLSVDYHYDLHQNRISRVTIGGGVYNPHLLKFDDQYGEAKVKVPDGTPYSIDDHYIALRGYAGYRQIYRFQESDRQNNIDIINYLSTRLQREKLPKHVVVNGKYELYSPFMSAIITHVLANERKYIEFDYHNKAKVARLISKFKFLLNSDPCVKGYDEDFAIVDPRPFDQAQPTVVHHRIYALFEYINQTYLNNKVRLNGWFKVTRTRRNVTE